MHMHLELYLPLELVIRAQNKCEGLQNDFYVAVAQCIIACLQRARASCFPCAHRRQPQPQSIRATSTATSSSCVIMGIIAPSLELLGFRSRLRVDAPQHQGIEANGNGSECEVGAIMRIGGHHIRKMTIAWSDGGRKEITHKHKHNENKAIPGTYK